VATEGLTPDTDRYCEMELRLDRPIDWMFGSFGVGALLGAGTTCCGVKGILCIAGSDTPVFHPTGAAIVILPSHGAVDTPDQNRSPSCQTRGIDPRTITPSLESFAGGVQRSSRWRRAGLGGIRSRPGRSRTEGKDVSQAVTPARQARPSREGIGYGAIAM